MEKSTICRLFSCNNHGFSTSMSVWVNPSFYVHPFHVFLDRWTLPSYSAIVPARSHHLWHSPPWPPASRPARSCGPKDRAKQCGALPPLRCWSNPVVVEKKGGHTCRKMTCFRAYVFFGKFHRLIRLIYHNPISIHIN